MRGTDQSMQKTTKMRINRANAMNNESPEINLNLKFIINNSVSHLDTAYLDIYMNCILVLL